MRSSFVDLNLIALKEEIGYNVGFPHRAAFCGKNTSAIQPEQKQIS